MLSLVDVFILGWQRCRQELVTHAPFHISGGMYEHLEPPTPEEVREILRGKPSPGPPEPHELKEWPIG